MLNKIVYDLETQREFAEVGGRNKYHLLRVSVAAAYSYTDDRYYTFEERELHRFGEMLQGADQIIGFNIRQFDNRVLQPYLSFSIDQIPVLDILEEVEKSLGHRIGLDALAQATLGSGKSGTGMQAIALWRQGLYDELKKYCLADVRLTKEIYDYGIEHGRLRYKDFFEVREIPVKFPQAQRRENIVRQTSLF